ncbi:hypothetical protein BN77_3751 [Rhizobium mesoamericanum STM3625]|uniref:Uncharacterized protein n=1 Tax=Rhizobium mesoamericanum STM3625 TaxID=1211777 RepID=K0Q2J4_9HYPH|nr:hypothetical protein BN77_3751 [Rhizobium mesoamericanum STM3625]
MGTAATAFTDFAICNGTKPLVSSFQKIAANAGMGDGVRAPGRKWHVRPIGRAISNSHSSRQRYR